MYYSVTARACANIAFIKYWGNRPEGGNLPLNPSISMNLAGCVTTTRLDLLSGGAEDEVVLNGEPAAEKARVRVTAFLDEIRRRAGRTERARVESRNSFPTGSGIASSASGFAALAAAAARAYGLDTDEAELSRLARLGSGSAARSVPGGFVELAQSDSHEGAFAHPLAGESHWPELRDVIVIFSEGEKEVSSADGHRLAATSEMFAGRLGAIPKRCEGVRRAIRERDMRRLGCLAEEDALSMHAVMMTSRPALLYWAPRTVEAIQTVWALRRNGVEAWFTIDAGPNVHVITLDRYVKDVFGALAKLGSVRVESAGPAARVVAEEGA